MLLGVLSRFLNIGARFLHIDRALAVNAQFVTDVHGFAPFLFSIIVNSSSMRWYSRSNFIRGDSNRSARIPRVQPARGLVSKSLAKMNVKPT